MDRDTIHWVGSYTETNRSLWDGWTGIHAEAAFYDVEGFKRGASSLKSVELEEVGAVEGRTLLHLQCHFGLDTLSWARRGATVTGVDFSERAIALARDLSHQLDIPARFVCSDVLELDLGERFDVVFTSYGAICWLGDLARWARAIADHLAPGGAFHMVEFHPLATALDDDGRTLRFPYARSGDPDRHEERGSYAEPDAPFSHASYQWYHGIGDVVSALLAAGLRIEQLREHPFSSYGCFPFLERVGPDRWEIRDGPRDVPLMFSLQARRDAG